MLTRFETTSGRLAVSAMNPAAMTNASVALSLNPSARSMAMTIGVRISAAPSLANNADTAAPSSTIRTKSRRPCPLPQRATCSAAHSKDPASSSNRLMTMIETNAAVAFQTMPQTTGTSDSVTTPASSAKTAPPIALHPIPSPLGCQMTSTIVTTKIRTARSIRRCAGPRRPPPVVRRPSRTRRADRPAADQARLRTAGRASRRAVRRLSAG